VHAVRDLLEQPAPPDATIESETHRVLALIDGGRRPEDAFHGTDHPAAIHLANALAAVKGPAETLAGEIARIAPALPWKYSYPPRQDAPDLGERIAFAELVGPAAPLRSDALCLGVTLIAPQTLYPLHRHPAIELYLVLSGTAAWSAGGPPSLRPPGTWVLHPSEVVHSMETGAEPLLALYCWTGEDIRTSSSYT
jgi:quercetin dioxygenase-like cupin family protein